MDNAGRLIQGDNLAVMRREPDGSLDLIYLDPPFFSGRRHHLPDGGGFADVWPAGMPGYLAWLRPRLEQAQRLLAAQGTLWLHLDWRAVHYVKVEADRVFGAARFRGQVVWAYSFTARGAKAVAGQLPRNHDVLLVYARGPRPRYRPVYVERLIPPAALAQHGYRRDAEGRLFRTAPRGDYTDASIARLESEGRVHHTRTGSVRIKYLVDEREGHAVEQRQLGDVWADIPDAMHTGRERTGYPTQKPLALLERIIACATDRGDRVADFVCGSGTTALAAARMGRRWLACDDNPEAIALTARRLGDRPFVIEQLSPGAEAAGG